MFTLLTLLSLFLWQQSPADHATVEGTVIDDATGEPLAGATITRTLPRPANLQARIEEAVRTGAGVSPQDIQAVGSLTIQTQTDGKGHFVFENLDTGRIDLGFSKDGYVVKKVTYTVRPSEHLRSVAVRLSQSGLVSGRISSPSGAPIIGAEITPFRYQYPNGTRELVAYPGTTTDDRGEFRLFDMIPGEYMLGVSSRVSSPLIPPVVANSPILRSTLYPGVTELSKAETIEVKPGVERALQDVILGDNGLGHIRVRLSNPAQQPAKTVTYLLSTFTTTVSSTRPDGGFSTSSGSLSPARGTSLPPELIESGSSVVKEFAVPGPGKYSVIASWPGGRVDAVVEFTGRTLDLNLDLGPKEGRLSCSALLEEVPGTFRPTSISIQLTNNSNEVVRCNPRADGPTSPQSLRLGHYDLAGGITGRFPAGMFLVSVRQGDRDVLTRGVEVTKENTVLELIFRTGSGILKGRVSTNQSPTAGALVALISSNAGGSLDAIYRSVRTDQNGDFDLRGLPAGSFAVYAWANASDDAFMNPEFLKRFADRGKLIQLEPNQEHSMNIQVLDQQ